MRRWLIGIMIAMNQLVNALSGGNPQESLSSRAAHARERGSKLGSFWCAAFDVFDKHHPDPNYPDGADHCTIAIIDHENRLKQNLEGDHAALRP